MGSLWHLRIENYKYISIAFCILIFFNSCTFKKSYPVIQSPYNEFDLGVIDFDSSYNIKYLLKNSGSEILKIDTVTSSCGCSTPTLSKYTLGVGEESVLAVQFKAVDTGDFMKKIILKSNVDSGFTVFSFFGYALKK